jgi:hypothetical protein
VSFICTLMDVGPWLCSIHGSDCDAHGTYADVASVMDLFTSSLLLPLHTVWMWAVLLTFWRYTLLPCSGFKVSAVSHWSNRPTVEGWKCFLTLFLYGHWTLTPCSLLPWRWRQDVLPKHQQHYLHPHGTKTQQPNLHCLCRSWLMISLILFWISNYES